jgi:hypothetical protein
VDLILQPTKELRAETAMLILEMVAVEPVLEVLQMQHQPVVAMVVRVTA